MAFGPTPMGTFGGGTSPLKTNETILFNDVGKVAVWAADGYLEIATDDYLTEAPEDGTTYGRRGFDHAWVPIAASSTVIDEPIDGRTYTRTGQPAEWVPLPYIIPEAPPTGQSYTRNGLNQTWVLAFNQIDASALYARNLLAFLSLVVDAKERRLKLDATDEIVKAALLTRDGAIVHPAFAPAVAGAAP